MLFVPLESASQLLVKLLQIQVHDIPLEFLQLVSFLHECEPERTAQNKTLPKQEY